MRENIMNPTYHRYIRSALSTGLAVVTALLTACGGGSSNSAAAKALDGFDALVASSVLPSNSTQCPSGGVRLDSGADTNRNKVLDATEITGTQYVCNGTNGANGSAGSNALVQMLTEPVGSNCSIGGTKIVAGLDSNANNKLDASEITSTAYVCNGSNGTNGSNGLSTLMNTATESAGSNCASGGKKITSGLDANADGVLDSSEVSSTAYVCNGSNGAAGSNGLQSLIRTATETAGTNCANGGIKITSGLDSNSNGTLDASEVSSTAYTCNGANGSNGANGHNTLMSTSTEPAGANCTYGGSKITSWLDSNDNGTLDSSETPAISYVCNGAFLSWVTVNTPTVQAQPNTGYRANHASAQVVITLPANPAENDIIRVVGTGAGGWKIAQNAGQQILLRNVPETTGVNWTPHLFPSQWYAVAASADGSKLVAAVLGGQIYTSSDSGATWTARESNRPWTAVASSADGSKLVAVADGRQIYTSTDSGATWTARESNRRWTAVASSADGSKLVAVVLGDQIYTSTDSGANWTARESNRMWTAVASSADGSKLVAVERGGQIYTSTNSGVTWTPRESNREWFAVASSADGSKLVAADFGTGANGQIYTSTDYGVSWTAQTSAGSTNDWRGVAISADGSKLAAVGYLRAVVSTDGGNTWTVRDQTRAFLSLAMSADGSVLVGGTSNNMLYTSASATTPGTAGWVSGAMYDAMELQHVGNGQFIVLSRVGRTPGFQ
jgi:hypothetical protein